MRSFKVHPTLITARPSKHLEPENTVGETPTRRDRHIRERDADHARSQSQSITSPKGSERRRARETPTKAYIVYAQTVHDKSEPRSEQAKPEFESTGKQAS
jgi:hypothetical protein